MSKSDPLDVRSIRFAGIEAAKPGPGVIESLADAEMVILAPSNPFVSIGPILGVPGVRAALETTKAVRVAISPIIAGQVVKGPAAKMMTTLGYEVSALGVAKIYNGLVDLFVLLADFLSVDDDYRRTHGARPEAVELAFGIAGADPVDEVAEQPLGTPALGIARRASGEFQPGVDLLKDRLLSRGAAGDVFAGLAPGTAERGVLERKAGAWVSGAAGDDGYEFFEHPANLMLPPRGFRSSCGWLPRRAV